MADLLDACAPIHPFCGNHNIHIFHMPDAFIVYVSTSNKLCLTVTLDAGSLCLTTLSIGCKEPMWLVPAVLFDPFCFLLLVSRSVSSRIKIINPVPSPLHTNSTANLFHWMVRFSTNIEVEIWVSFVRVRLILVT